MAKTLTLSLTKQEMFPQTLDAARKLLDADNIPQAFLYNLALRVIEVLVDAGINALAGTTIDKETSLKIDITNGEIQFGRFGANLAGRTSVIEIVDAWDFLNYFVINGFKLEVDEVALVGFIAWQIAHNIGRIAIEAGGIRMNAPFNIAGFNRPSNRTESEEEVAHV